MPVKQGHSHLQEGACDCDQAAKRAKSGDEQAFALVLTHARPKIRGYVRCGLDAGSHGDDLASIGENVLWHKVIPAFSPAKAGQGGFAAYARMVLRLRLRDELLKLRYGSAVVPLEAFRKLMRAYNRLVEVADYSRRPMHELLHEETGCQIDTCWKFLSTRSQPVSLSGEKGEADLIGSNSLVAQSDNDTHRLLVVNFTLDVWLPLQSARMTPILENELSCAPEKAAGLAEKLSCSAASIKSDGYTAKAWLALIHHLACHHSACSDEVAYDRLHAWVNRVSARKVEDEPKVDKLLRRFRERRKLKLSDIKKIRRLLVRYVTEKQKEATDENA